MGKRQAYSLILVTLLAGVSCLNRQFVKGRAELLSVTDSLLNDSCLLEGHVTYFENTAPLPPLKDWFEVWLNTGVRTTTDSTGYYSIKTLPGTYTIRCQTRGNVYEPLIEEISNIKIEKNQKVSIDFYIGYSIE